VDITCVLVESAKIARHHWNPFNWLRKSMLSWRMKWWKKW